MVIKNYGVTGVVDEGVGVNVDLLTGVTNGSIVKTLAITAGSEACVCYIKRATPGDTVYHTIKVDLEPYAYVELWNGFYVVEAGYKLKINADSTQCKVTADVVEL